MDIFSHGPFSFAPGRAVRVNGVQSRRWEMQYGSDFVAEHALPESADRSSIIVAFASDRASFIAGAMGRHAPGRISLIDYESGEEVGHFFSDDNCGLTPGLIDDRSRYWLRSADRLYSLDVTLTQYAQVAAEHSAPPLSWVAGLLPDDVLTRDAANWRAPTSWELRHVVGEGSFTGVAGAAAAALVGVTPQNFRKYTARDDAATRQNISFAMWHLLLHKLGVRRA